MNRPYSKLQLDQLKELKRLEKAKKRLLTPMQSFLAIGATTIGLLMIAYPIQKNNYQIYSDSSTKESIDIIAVNLMDISIFNDLKTARELSFNNLYKQNQLYNNINEIGYETKEGFHNRKNVTDLLRAENVFENRVKFNIVLNNLQAHIKLSKMIINADITLEESEKIAEQIVGKDVRLLNSFVTQKEDISEYLSLLPKESSISKFESKIKELRNYNLSQYTQKQNKFRI